MYTLDSLYLLIDEICKKQHIFGKGQAGEEEFRKYLVKRMRENYGKNAVCDEFIIRKNLYLNEKHEDIDIILRGPMDIVPIELKYQHRTNNTTRKNASYFFLKDICRIEHHLQKQDEFGDIGYAVLMTDDSGYWEGEDQYPPTGKELTLHNGRSISGTIAMYSGTGEPKSGKYAPLSLQGSYKIKWRCGVCNHFLEGIHNCNCNNFKFRYTVVKIDKNKFSIPCVSMT